jgi:hypothetical protein
MSHCDITRFDLTHVMKTGPALRHLGHSPRETAVQIDHRQARTIRTLTRGQRLALTSAERDRFGEET